MCMRVERQFRAVRTTLPQQRAQATTTKAQKLHLHVACMLGIEGGSTRGSTTFCLGLRCMYNRVQPSTTLRVSDLHYSSRINPPTMTITRRVPRGRLRHGTPWHLRSSPSQPTRPAPMQPVQCSHSCRQHSAEPASRPAPNPACRAAAAAPCTMIAAAALREGCRWPRPRTSLLIVRSWRAMTMYRPRYRYLMRWPRALVAACLPQPRASSRC